MESQTIQFAPERRKGTQSARYGRGISQMGGISSVLQKQISRQHMTPNELAAWKLNQALEAYPKFTKDARNNAQSEFVNMPSLRTMNMKLLAATLSFLLEVGGSENITPASFQDEIIIPHIKPLLPNNLNPKELFRLTVRFKAQILMYVIAINNFRESE